MAILKHISSRNAKYTDAVNYLIYEHDAKSGKIIKDENGRPVMRENMIIEGIGCIPETFDIECLQTNAFYGKNQKRGEIKSHSYIISFDPRDQEDNGLTLQAAQDFGMEFARKYLNGYQAVVCTHADGHNKSGNIHCHIVINSLRCRDVKYEQYMDQKTDNLAGYKHRCTSELVRFLESKVMQMCKERGLYQVDLLTPARRRVTDREYHAARRGAENEGETFATRKDQLRTAIEYAARNSKNAEEFKMLLSSLYNITVKESRGRYSYIFPDRTYGITERQLGTDYGLKFLEKVFRGEAEFAGREISDAYVRADIGRIVDIETNEKAQNSAGYMYVLKKSNLQRLADSLAYFSEHRFNDIDDVQHAIDSLNDRYAENAEKIKAIEKQLSELHDIHQAVNNRDSLKSIVDRLKSGKESGSYRTEHEGDLILYNAALEQIGAYEEKGGDIDIKAFDKKIEKLIQQKSALYEERGLIKKDVVNLQRAMENVIQAGLGTLPNKEISRDKILK